MEDPRTIWDRRYAWYHQAKIAPAYETWLEPWRSFLEASKSTPVLDLGCGQGCDSQYLTAKGFQVIAVDYSGEALKIVRQQVTEAEIVQVDLRQGLPFPANTFQVIIASLSLHYFPWEQTRTIISQIRRCLREKGVLLARLNSSNDTNYGARGHQALEPNYFLVKGVLKRFFDRESLDHLFAAGWQVEGVAERVLHRYDKPKTAWEVVVRKVKVEARKGERK